MPPRRRRRTAPNSRPSGRSGHQADIGAIIRLIRENQSRLAALDNEARTLRRELGAVRSSIGAEPSRGAARPAAGPRPPRVWPSTIAGRALAALREAGRPMHIDALLRAIRRSSGRNNMTRATLVGQLARDVRKGRLFRRTAPNQYGLTAWATRRTRTR